MFSIKMEETDMEQFLNHWHNTTETLTDKLNNPYLLKNMCEAIDRLSKAINNREKIVIYGYYDVDGITSVSLLLLLLRYLNADVEYFIPENINMDREISYEVVKNHIKFLGANLIITVGLGINSSTEVELCKNLGIDVIITDYRDVAYEIPKAIVVDPKQPGCQYPFKNLSGAGVTYKLAQAIALYYRVKCASKYLDLCMLGTISSEVPIIDENKVLVEEGILHLCKTNNYGIKALIKEYNVFDINQAAAYKLAFTVIPRINAIGRMDNARIAVELFTTGDEYRASQIAKYLIKEVDINKNMFFIK